MGVGNTFGATVLSSYGGFWISLSIAFIPGGFKIMSTYEEASGGKPGMFYDALGLFIFVSISLLQFFSAVKLIIDQQGWVIFTTMITYLTMRSTLALFLLFFFVDVAFILLGIAYFVRDEMDMPHEGLSKAGGFFAILGAFLAWYNGWAGIADNSNSFFVPPVVHFPWSEKGRESRRARASMISANPGS